MSERHLHSLNPVRIIEQAEYAVMENGLKGLLVFAVSFALCPGDDIAAIASSLVPGGDEVVVHQGAIPSEDQYLLRIREVETKGGGSRKLPKPRSFKQ